MKIEFASFSNTGPRASNQDRVLVPSSKQSHSFIAAIADGIGGSIGGGEAASIAVALAAELEPVSSALPSLFNRVVDTLRERAGELAELENMGTTLSVAVLEEWAVSVGHVGDTRIYHMRGHGLNSLTHDQTEVAELVRKGVLTASRAKRYARRNVLLSALSPKGDYEMQAARTSLQKGDRLLLVTDGVHQRVTRGAILNVSLAHPCLQEFVVKLEQLAIEGKPSDNFSALAIQIIN